jgi:hypothetical protein
MALPNKTQIAAATTGELLDALFLANNVNCTGDMTGASRNTNCADCPGCTDCVGCVGCTNCRNCSYLTNCTDCSGCDGTSTDQATSLLRCVNVDKSDNCTDCSELTNSQHCVNCHGEPAVTAAGNKYGHLWRCSDLRQCNCAAYCSAATGLSYCVGSAAVSYNQAGYNTAVWSKTGRSW